MEWREPLRGRTFRQVSSLVRAVSRRFRRTNSAILLMTDRLDDSCIAPDDLANAALHLANRSCSASSIEVEARPFHGEPAVALGYARTATKPVCTEAAQSDPPSWMICAQHAPRHSHSGRTGEWTVGAQATCKRRNRHDYTTTHGRGITTDDTARTAV